MEVPLQWSCEILAVKLTSGILKFKPSVFLKLAKTFHDLERPFQ